MFYVQAQPEISPKFITADISFVSIKKIAQKGSKYRFANPQRGRDEAT
jgi:hypothetical protein